MLPIQKAFLANQLEKQVQALSTLERALHDYGVTQEKLDAHLDADRALSEAIRTFNRDNPSPFTS